MFFQIGQYQLDVDSPYPIPTPEVKSKKPETIGYPTTNIRFRFYGRNLQMMVDKVSEMQDPELRQEMVNLIASFMYNSCKIWNNENVDYIISAPSLPGVPDTAIILELGVGEGFIESYRSKYSL